MNSIISTGNNSFTPEQRKKRIENVVKYAGIGLVGLLSLPFVFGAILGTIGLLIFGVLATFIISFAPVFGKMIGNWKLKAIKAEAMRNPVETLQNEYAKKMDALIAFKENIRVFNGQVLSFSDQVKQYVIDGLEDANVYVEQLDKMKRLLALRYEKYNTAKESLDEFEHTIKNTDRKWKMACAAIKMNEAAGQMEGDVFDKICIETALESVQTKLNQSFADLEIALLDDNKEKAKQLYAEKQKKQLSSPVNTNSKIIDIEPVLDTAKSSRG